MTTFSKLLTVSIDHDYYQSACQDFDFIIPADSQQLLRNGRVLARTREGSLYLVYEQIQADTPYSSLDGNDLQIGLSLHNPAFSNFTNLPAVESGTVPVYRNVTQATSLDAAVGYHLVGRELSHSLNSADRPLTLSLRNGDDVVVWTEEFSADDPRAVFSLDLNPYPTGIYTVEEVTSAGTTQTLYFYQPEFHRLGVFGIIQLKLVDSFYTTPPAFVIAFNARSDVLKYYVVADNYNDSDLNQLDVSDTGFSDGGWPQISFTKLDSGAFASDDIPPALLLRNNSDAKLVLFKSLAPVARRESARTKIQLKKHNEVLIKNLPSPAGSRSIADVIIQISKP